MRRSGIATLVVMALCGGMMACSSSSKDAAAQKQAQARYLLHTSGPVLYSPNGEPLSGGVLGRPSCLEAVSKWFARVDANHDGAIDRGEFLADARIQFLRMDLDGDSAIYPSELLTFRGSFQGIPKHNDDAPPAESFAEERAQLKAMGLIPSEDPEKDKDKKKLQDFSDPVMSADDNLDFKVTLDEYTSQAQDVFKAADLDHNGKLERIELMAACPPVSLWK